LFPLFLFLRQIMQRTNNNNSKTIKLKKMKNFLIAFVAGSILALATTNRANAQNSFDGNSPENRQVAINIDKSVFSAASTTAVNTNTISAKALKDFKKSFKNASDEKWFKNENGVTARFSLNGISNVIYYDKKGNWQASLKGYSEDKLDRNVRDIVKQKYYDYKITLVQEIETVSTLGTPAYMIHIEGDNDFKTVRVIDGAMDVYEEFAKQK
jgi:hypothetical protein